MKKNVAPSRALKMLAGDRLGLTLGAEEVICQDIEKLLGEFFYLKTRPKVYFDAVGDKIDIKIEAQAKSAKKFYMLQ